VLQRFGGPPLREELSVAALGLRDGDVVHLRPREEQLPPLDFDDLIDGVATTISTRPDRWRPDMSRRLLGGLLAVPLAAGLAVLAGHPGLPSDIIAAALAFLLIGLAAAASRAFADLPAAGYSVRRRSATRDWQRRNCRCCTAQRPPARSAG
jgi:hypothetical protein